MNIIELAKEAGFTDHEYIEDGYVCTSAELERFATSIALTEAEKWRQALPIAMDAMMLQEREACAELFESAPNQEWSSELVAYQIRNVRRSHQSKE